MAPKHPHVADTGPPFFYRALECFMEAGTQGPRSASDCGCGLVTLVTVWVLADLWG